MELDETFINMDFGHSDYSLFEFDDDEVDWC